MMALIGQVKICSLRPIYSAIFILFCYYILSSSVYDVFKRSSVHLTYPDSSDSS